MGSKLLISAAVGALVGAVAVLLFRQPLVIKVVDVTWVPPNSVRLSAQSLTISKSGDQVRWQATPTSSNMKVLFIEFEQKIFSNADPINGRYRVSCSEGVCNSGAVLASPPQPPTSAGYNYWYGLAESTTSLPVWGSPYGRIIIIKP
jgi:hypothetical protein